MSSQVCCANEQPQPVTQSPIEKPRPVPGRGLSPGDLPQPGTCGNHLADRIVGGTETAINEFPWMVLIEYTKRNSCLLSI